MISLSETKFYTIFLLEDIIVPVFQLNSIYNLGKLPHPILFQGRVAIQNSLQMSSHRDHSDHIHDSPSAFQNLKDLLGVLPFYMSELIPFIEPLHGL